MGAKRHKSLFSNISIKKYLSKLIYFYSFYSHLSLVNTKRGVGNFFITDFTSFLHLLVHRLDESINQSINHINQSINHINQCIGVLGASYCPKWELFFYQ